MTTIKSVDFNKIPKGWFVIGKSSLIKKGSVKTIHYFDQEFVIYRGKNREITILTPHCVHLGAHLGDGVIVNNCLRCPFHGWEYNSQGQVIKIPFTNTIPRRARKKTLPNKEINGFIFVYFTHDNEPPIPFPIVSFLNQPHWKYSHVRESIIDASIYSISENLGDKAHFPVVHDTFVSHAQLDSFITEENNNLKAKLSVSTKKGFCWRAQNIEITQNTWRHQCCHFTVSFVFFSIHIGSCTYIYHTHRFNVPTYDKNSCC